MILHVINISLLTCFKKDILKYFLCDQAIGSLCSCLSRIHNTMFAQISTLLKPLKTVMKSSITRPVADVFVILYFDEQLFLFIILVVLFKSFKPLLMEDLEMFSPVNRTLWNTLLLSYHIFIKSYILGFRQYIMEFVVDLIHEMKCLLELLITHDIDILVDILVEESAYPSTFDCH